MFGISSENAKKCGLLFFFFLNTGLFICFVYSRLSNFSAITDDWAANLGLCSALRAFEQGRIFIVPTPTATRDLSLYGLIRKTGTHVLQWGSNPDLKDHQIFEPDALTTAPRGRLGSTSICDLF